MTTEIRTRVFYGCHAHPENFYSRCDSCVVATLGRLCDEVERLDEELKNKREIYPR